MNEQQIARALMTISQNARVQTPEARENYFRSLEAHGEEMAALVKKIRAQYGFDYSI